MRYVSPSKRCTTATRRFAESYFQPSSDGKSFSLINPYTRQLLKVQGQILRGL
ncbi:hypothetical protein BJX68DRAFT_238424 [Aspergillus pseudodeflectus]|uniref:Uncharacterized protein n=1 Tax=Aspergillus pseudodeflectus TaxID=176178 RepID=A0ABR4K8P0_9EURO